MLRTVKWGEYKTSELFKPQKITKMLSKEDLSDQFCFPAYSSETTNNGIIGYTNTPEFICDEKHPVYITFGDHTRTFNIATNSFSVLDNVKVLLPTISNIHCLLWIITAWQKQIPNLGYARHWKIAKDCVIKLPTQNNEIDFNFMESFMVKLETECLAELEAYLSVTGLNNYNLTDEELKVLKDYDNLPFKDVPVPELFEVNNASNILSKDVVENSGEYPYLCASADNNAVSTYISYDKKYMDKGNCIFIGGKTFVVTYQEKDFFSNDSHNLTLRLKEESKRSKDIQLYIATCVNKSLGHKYSWGDSISNKKIKNDVISLPHIGKCIDYDSMPVLISAIKKLVIKDVVLYADKRIEKNKRI
ncbi:restriction endonuclease subunit S [uncultured Prevotella sp.]|uniref:restriction endonuclease subunit S n=1 Tax=uncultured Prevotella sp. TaxID=159272 RepID=UPI003412AF81